MTAAADAGELYTIELAAETALGMATTVAEGNEESSPPPAAETPVRPKGNFLLGMALDDLDMCG